MGEFSLPDSTNDDSYWSYWSWRTYQKVLAGLDSAVMNVLFLLVFFVMVLALVLALACCAAGNFDPIKKPQELLSLSNIGVALLAMITACGLSGGINDLLVFLREKIVSLVGYGHSPKPLASSPIVPVFARVLAAMLPRRYRERVFDPLLHELLEDYTADAAKCHSEAVRRRLARRFHRRAVQAILGCMFVLIVEAVQGFVSGRYRGRFGTGGCFASGGHKAESLPSK
jgi:hypothetical protein